MPRIMPFSSQTDLGLSRESWRIIGISRLLVCEDDEVIVKAVHDSLARPTGEDRARDRRHLGRRGGCGHRIVARATRNARQLPSEVIH